MKRLSLLKPTQESNILLQTITSKQNWAIVIDFNNTSSLDIIKIKSWVLSTVINNVIDEKIWFTTARRVICYRSRFSTN